MSNHFDTVETAVENPNYKRGDVVKMYKEDTKLEYPCIMLKCEKLEMFRVEAMKGVLGTKSLINEDNQYNVYINIQGQIVQVGVIPSTKLKFILSNKIFDIFEKCVHSDAQTTVTGDMLYALCMTSSVS